MCVKGTLCTVIQNCCYYASILPTIVLYTASWILLLLACFPPPQGHMFNQQQSTQRLLLRQELVYVTCCWVLESLCNEPDSAEVWWSHYVDFCMIYITISARKAGNAGKWNGSEDGFKSRSPKNVCAHDKSATFHFEYFTACWSCSI